MSIPFSTDDVDAPSSNTAAVLTYAALAERKHVLYQIDYSYDGAPTAGALTVTLGGVTVFSLDVVAAGRDTILFSPEKEGKHNSAMVITLADGGVGVSGKLNATHGTA
jgi:hypothetical protein